MRFQQLILISICIFFALQVHARDMITVKVGGYAFPPFVDMSSGQPAGITPDLINALNALQDRYRFVFFLTSPKRRYYDFKKGLYDIIFFEDILWGWEDQPVEKSKIFLTGGEVYIARTAPERTQSYFDDLKEKTKAGILGYHYGFANFDPSPEMLYQKHKMRLYTHHRRLIESVLDGQADLALVPDSYLSYFLKKNPAIVPRLLISKKYDQIYRHTALVRKGTSPKVDEINHLLDRLKKNGGLHSLLKKYGLNETSPDPGERNTLVIGVSFSIPPYIIKEKDTGIELDILRQAFTMTNRHVQIKYLPLTRTFSLLKAGTIDGVINIKPGMLDKVFYSDVVLTFRNCAISLAKKGYPDFKTPAFLTGKHVIAFQRARQILGPAFASATADPTMYEEVADQENQVLRLFLERDADLVVMEKKIFTYYHQKAVEDQIIGGKAAVPVRFHEIFPPTEYRFAFKNQQIRDDFNHGLRTMRANGSFQQILKKYEMHGDEGTL